MFTISNSIAKTPRDKLLFLIYKKLCNAGLFCYIVGRGDHRSSVKKRIFVGDDVLGVPFFIAVQFVKIPAFLFTFCCFCGIIYLIDKLEFVGENIM